MDSLFSNSESKKFDWTLVAVGGIVALAGTFLVKIVAGLLSSKK